MAKTKTHIQVILDRTGSMASRKEEVIGGFNGFIDKQREVKGNCTLTLVQFDDVDPYETLQNFIDIQSAPKLTNKTYSPRGMTPLYDAMGKGVVDLHNHLSAVKKKDRPDKVIFVVITDGEENASQEYNKDSVEKLIEAHKDDWQFVFMGSDFSGMKQARSTGISYDSTLVYDNTPIGTSTAFANLSSNVSRFRTGESEQAIFTAEERSMHSSESLRDDKDTD